MKKTFLTLAILILAAPGLFALTGRQIIDKSESLPEPKSAEQYLSKPAPAPGGSHHDR